MQIQAGKFYKTRGGNSIAYVAAVGAPFQAHDRDQCLGWIMIDGDADVAHWYRDGRHDFDRQKESSLDLVAELPFDQVAA